MTHPKSHNIRFAELCDVTELSSRVILEIVEHGIVEPEGAQPENWVFNVQMVTVTKKACRLHRDLGIAYTVLWAGQINGVSCNLTSPTLT